MARPTLMGSKKFKRLCRELKLPRYAVRGLLELMWDTCHECGDEHFRCPEDVEAAAEWDGDEGLLASTLIRLRWLDTNRTGVLSVHHYWHHAPEYVKKRLKRESERVEEAAENGRQRRTLAAVHRQRRLAAANGKPPAPAPSPSPTPAPSPAPKRSRSDSALSGSAGSDSVVQGGLRRGREARASSGVTSIGEALPNVIPILQGMELAKVSPYSMSKAELLEACASLEVGGATDKNREYWRKRLNDAVAYKGGTAYVREVLQHIFNSIFHGEEKGVGRIKNPPAYLNGKLREWCASKAS